MRQRPAIELWQIDWLLKYEDQGTGWDEALAANSPPAGTTMAAVTGRDVVDFLQRERRKGLAEAAFEAHLQGWRVCRCAIGCVLDADCEPVEPRRFAMSGEC